MIEERVIDFIPTTTPDRRRTIMLRIIGEYELRRTREGYPREPVLIRRRAETLEGVVAQYEGDGCFTIMESLSLCRICDKDYPTQAGEPPDLRACKPCLESMGLLLRLMDDPLKELRQRMMAVATDLCLCGTGADFDLLLDVLKHFGVPFEQRDGEWSERLYAWGAGGELAAKVLAKASLTEHGGGVSGSWLSDKGKDLLRRIG